MREEGQQQKWADVLVMQGQGYHLEARVVGCIQLDHPSIDCCKGGWQPRGTAPPSKAHSFDESSSCTCHACCIHKRWPEVCRVFDIMLTVPLHMQVKVSRPSPRLSADRLEAHIAKSLTQPEEAERLDEQ